MFGLWFINFEEFKQFLHNHFSLSKTHDVNLIFEISDQKKIFFKGSKLDCLNNLELKKLTHFHVRIYSLHDKD